MHELSIAESMVQIANRHANGRRVTKVWVKVGHLRQVVPSALAFGFELVAEGTPVEGLHLLARGQQGAISAVAASPRGTMLRTPNRPAPSWWAASRRW